MVTAAMIAMFYLGTASGVIGAVLVSTSRSHDTAAPHPLEDTVLGSGELRQAA